MKMCRPTRLVRFARLVGLVVLALPVGLAGCGGSKGTVTGTITFNGQPLGNGQVMFINQKDPSKAQAANIQADGTYTVASMPPGPATITVQTFPTSGSTGAAGQVGGDTLKQQGGMQMPKPADAGGKYVKIPDKYRNKEQSGLTYDVKSGKQKHDIELQ